MSRFRGPCVKSISGFLPGDSLTGDRLLAEFFGSGCRDGWHGIDETGLLIASLGAYVMVNVGSGAGIYIVGAKVPIGSPWFSSHWMCRVMSLLDSASPPEPR